MNIFTDRVHRLPRLWSNEELKKVAPLFSGKVINVSGWKDQDKDGKHYRDYFSQASDYSLSNYKSDARGFQGLDKEIFLDLTADLPENLQQQFDVVFNHTTLEHIYDMQKAFANLCSLSKDVVILVLPFLQKFHTSKGAYQDYWRFSPLAVQNLFQENGFSLVYQSFNSHPSSSVYVFSIASRKPEAWQSHFNWTFSCEDPQGSGSEPYIGCRAIPNKTHQIFKKGRKVLRWPLQIMRRIVYRIRS